MHKALKRISKARAALDAEEVVALRDAQRMRLWKEFGYASLIEYMERELLYTARAAVERLRVANIIEELPEIEAALQQGNLSFSGARELSRVVTPETQQAWLDAVQNKNVRQIEEMVSGHKRGDVPDDPVDEQAMPQVLRFEVTQATATIVRHYQKLRTKQLGTLIDDDLVIREVFQLALDKLVEDRQRPFETAATPSQRAASPTPAMMEALAATPALPRSESTNRFAPTEPATPDASTSGACDSSESAESIVASILGFPIDAEPFTATGTAKAARPPSARPRYQHSIMTCDACGRAWLHAAGTSTRLTAPQLETARCDADELGYVDAAGPVRKRSKIPPAVRNKVLARDGHRCRVPGCRSTNIDVHHLHPWEIGGSHDESNLLTLCEGHHLAVHNGKLIIRGSAPDVTFEFATLDQPANRFAIEARAVETQRALEQLGFSRHEASAAVRAARTHVGMNDRPVEVWLRAALAATSPRSGL